MPRVFFFLEMIVLINRNFTFPDSLLPLTSNVSGREGFISFSSAKSGLIFESGVHSVVQSVVERVDIFFMSFPSLLLLNILSGKKHDQKTRGI